MAQLWKFPVVYVCENNLYNEYTHHAESTAGSIRARAEAFGLHTEEIDGQDVRLVYLTTLRLVERARQAQGPAFLLCHTYRYHGHHVGHINRGYYRPKEEEQLWKTERDPLQLLADWLTQARLAHAAILEGIEKEVRVEGEMAVKFALNAPYPAPAEVTKHVYV